MKITLVSQDFPPETGGIQVYAHQLAREFSKHHRVTVLAPSIKGGSKFDKGQPYSTFRYPIGHTSLFGLTTPASIPYLAERTGGRVAFHAQYTTAMGSLLAKRMGIIDHYYVACHAREILRANRSSVSRAIFKAVTKESSGLFPVSRYTGQLLEDLGASKEKIHVVNNGADLDFFYPRKNIDKGKMELSDKFVILTAARLIKRKGIDTVIDALHLLKEEFENLVYVVIGDGPCRKELQDKARALIEEEKVVFKGRVKDEELPLYYSLADVFVMPSREEKGGCVEGFGLVFLEANACGTPVIGSWSGGIPDAVEDGKSGLLVTPGNAKELSDAIRRLILDKSLRERLGDYGLKRAQRFTWEHSANRILDVVTRKKVRGPIDASLSMNIRNLS